MKINTFVGIDLAGSEKRNTGFCILRKKRAVTKILYTDEEIMHYIKELKSVKVIAIDAPLFLPLGRKNLRKRSKIHLRECDKELLKMHIKFFPITLGPMRKLTERGMKLRKKLEEMKKEKGRTKLKVIETYPGAVYDILKIKRQDAGIKKGLKSLGIKFDDKISRDELDSIACAYVAKIYYEKNFLALGKKEEGFMILPLPRMK